MTDSLAGASGGMDQLFAGANRSCLCDWLQPLVGNLLEPSFVRLVSEFEKAPNTFFKMLIQLRDELELQLGLDPTVGTCDFRLLANENREQRLDVLFACAQCLMNVNNHDMTGLYVKFNWSLFEEFVSEAFEFRLAPDDERRSRCTNLFFKLHIEATSQLAIISECNPSWTGFQSVAWWHKLLCNNSLRTFLDCRKLWNNGNSQEVWRHRPGKRRGDIQFLIQFLDQNFETRRPKEGWPR